MTDQEKIEKNTVKIHNYLDTNFPDKKEKIQKGRNLEKGYYWFKIITTDKKYLVEFCTEFMEDVTPNDIPFKLANELNLMDHLKDLKENEKLRIEWRPPKTHYILEILPWDEK